MFIKVLTRIVLAAAKPAAKAAAGKKPATKVAPAKGKVPPKALLSKPKRNVPLKQQKGLGPKKAPTAQSAPAVAKALRVRKKVYIKFKIV